MTKSNRTLCAIIAKAENFIRIYPNSKKIEWVRSLKEKSEIHYAVNMQVKFGK